MAHKQKSQKKEEDEQTIGGIVVVVVVVAHASEGGFGEKGATGINTKLKYNISLFFVLL